MWSYCTLPNLCYTVGILMSDADVISIDPANWATSASQPRRVIGTIIKRHRLRHELSQADLGNMVGASQSLVARWESGTIPGTDYILAIGLAFEKRVAVRGLRDFIMDLAEAMSDDPARLVADQEPEGVGERFFRAAEGLPAEYAVEALRIAERMRLRAGDQAGAARVAQSIPWKLQSLGNSTRVRDEIERIMRDYDQALPPRTRYELTRMLGTTLAALGDLSAGLETLEAAGEMARREGIIPPSFAPYPEHFMAKIWVQQAAAEPLGDALQLYRQAVGMFDLLGREHGEDTPRHGWDLIMSLWAIRERTERLEREGHQDVELDEDDFRERCERAKTLTVGDFAAEVHLACERAYLAGRQGAAIEDLRKGLRDAIELARAHDYRTGMALTYRMLALLESKYGNPKKGEQAVRDAEAATSSGRSIGET